MRTMGDLLGSLVGWVGLSEVLGVLQVGFRELLGCLVLEPEALDAAYDVYQLLAYFF